MRVILIRDRAHGSAWVRKKVQQSGPELSRRRFSGAPERIRTSDPQIRSLVLYPAELRAPVARL